MGDWIKLPSGMLVNVDTITSVTLGAYPPIGCVNGFNGCLDVDDLDALCSALESRCRNEDGGPK